MQNDNPHRKQTRRGTKRLQKEKTRRTGYLFNEAYEFLQGISRSQSEAEPIPYQPPPPPVSEEPEVSQIPQPFLLSPLELFVIFL